MNTTVVRVNGGLSTKLIDNSGETPNGQNSTKFAIVSKQSVNGSQDHIGLDMITSITEVQNNYLAKLKTYFYFS